MPRRAKKTSQTSSRSNFRFEYVHWTDQQVSALKTWLSGNAETIPDLLLGMVESGWKVSISMNEQTERFLVSLTDKWGRPGMSGLTYAVEHSEVTSAICGAYFYATEYLDNGLDKAERNEQLDQW